MQIFDCAGQMAPLTTPPPRHIVQGSTILSAKEVFYVD